MENRNGLVVDEQLTLASGTAEREAALAMLVAQPGTTRKTVGADKAYDQATAEEHDLNDPQMQAQVVKSQLRGDHNAGLGRAGIEPHPKPAALRYEVRRP